MLLHSSTKALAHPQTHLGVRMVTCGLALKGRPAVLPCSTVLLYITDSAVYCSAVLMPPAAGLMNVHTGEKKP